MRIKRVAISPELLPGFFKDNGAIRCTKSLPADAKFLRAHYDPVHDMFYLIFESETWPGVLKGAAIDDFAPEFERIQLNAPEENHEETTNRIREN